MSRTSRWILAAPALALAACTVTSGPPPAPAAPGPPEAGPGSPPAHQPAPFTKADPPAVLTSGAGSPSSPSGTAGPSQDPPAADPPGRACKLPAPKKSEDACKQDSDCGVSDPCHAAACVAKAKSNPPKADTMCTRMLACHSADVNRCGCFEGRCALIPPP